MQVDSWKDYEVRQVLPVQCRLGEGCVWDGRSKRLYFVDIEGCKIYGFCPADDSPDIWEFDTGQMVGCLVPCVDGTDSGIVAAAGHRLIWIGTKESQNQTKVLMELPLPEFVRFNDGKCDAEGRLWVGTMAVSQEHPDAKGCGCLYCISKNQVTASYPGYTIPNGMAWNGERFYHIDTCRGAIEEYRMEAGGGLTDRRTVVSVDAGDGAPDGMCMDSEGNLWTAMWGGGKVNCYDPRTGSKLAEIRVPVKDVSCVTFGDEDLRTLYITTAMDKDGLGGQLYGVRLPVAGVESNRYGGWEG